MEEDGPDIVFELAAMRTGRRHIVSKRNTTRAALLELTCAICRVTHGIHLSRFSLDVCRRKRESQSKDLGAKYRRDATSTRLVNGSSS